MLEGADGVQRVVLACGYVDLRKGIDGLSMIIGDKYRQNPFEKGTLFCGRRSDRIKGLLWRALDFYSCIRGLNQVPSHGRGLPKKLQTLRRNNTVT